MDKKQKEALDRYKGLRSFILDKVMPEVDEEGRLTQAEWDKINHLVTRDYCRTSSGEISMDIARLEAEEEKSRELKEQEYCDQAVEILASLEPEAMAIEAELAAAAAEDIASHLYDNFPIAKLKPFDFYADGRFYDPAEVKAEHIEAVRGGVEKINGVLARLVSTGEELTAKIGELQKTSSLSDETAGTIQKLEAERRKLLVGSEAARLKEVEEQLRIYREKQRRMASQATIAQEDIAILDLTRTRLGDIARLVTEMIYRPAIARLESLELVELARSMNELGKKYIEAAQAFQLKHESMKRHAVSVVGPGYYRTPFMEVQTVTIPLAGKNWHPYQPHGNSPIFPNQTTKQTVLGSFTY